MTKIAERISDKRLLKLIRSFLQAGVMEDGLVSPVDEGTPQGGPLSPLLRSGSLRSLRADSPTYRIAVYGPVRTVM